MCGSWKFLEEMVAEKMKMVAAKWKWLCRDKNIGIKIKNVGSKWKWWEQPEAKAVKVLLVLASAALACVGQFIEVQFSQHLSISDVHLVVRWDYDDDSDDHRDVVFHVIVKLPVPHHCGLQVVPGRCVDSTLLTMLIVDYGWLLMIIDCWWNE